MIYRTESAGGPACLRQPHKTRETRVTSGLKKKTKSPKNPIHTQSLQWSPVPRIKPTSLPHLFSQHLRHRIEKESPGHESFPNSELSKLHGERTPPRPKPCANYLTSSEEKGKANASESFLGRDAEETFISTTDERIGGRYRLQLLSRAIAA